MSERTHDHETVRRWADERGGRPAIVAGTETSNPKHAGLLRISFRDEGDDAGDTELEYIEWDRFFETFDANELDLVYEETSSDGGVSRFSKFVSRSIA